MTRIIASTGHSEISFLETGIFNPTLTNMAVP